MRRRFVRFLIASARLLPDEREGIWSIPRPLQVVYFPLFIGICVPLLIDTVKEVTALHIQPPARYSESPIPAYVENTGNPRVLTRLLGLC